MRAPLTLFAAAVLALGFALGGLFVGRGFVAARVGDRFVTVKGVAEREMKADLVRGSSQHRTNSPRRSTRSVRIPIPS
jgi:hypothetical protein